MNKVPILDEKDLDRLIEEALKGNGVLVTPKEVSQLLVNVSGVSINSKPRKDGRWQGYILDKGEKRYVYGTTKEEVAFRLKEYLRNGLPKKKSAEKNSVPTTFNAFAQYYFENFRVKKVAKRTFQCDMSRYNTHIAPYFKEKPLKKITSKDCQTLIENIEASGKGKTADEVYSLLSVIFKMAIRHDIIRHNPMDIIMPVQYESEHGKALTKTEEERLKTALDGSKLLQPFMILLYTGLRPNELKTARKENDFIIAVNSKRKNGKVEYKRIPVSKMLAPYVVDMPDGFPYLDLLRRTIRDILPGHKLYDLRTTFYSRCKECGISEYAIKEFMGHSLGALGNAYTDLSDKFLLSEMAKFEY